MLKLVQHDKLYNTPRCKSKIFAFTLAEVLITLVIIGVIAALTIPNLMQKYQEQATVKKVQKFYSNLTNAYSLAKKDNGTVSEWGLTGTDAESAKKIYELLFKPYFKITKECGTASGGCFANTYYNFLDGTSWGNPETHKLYYKIALSDGSAVLFSALYEGIPIAILYDVNGKQGPNQFGIDFFEFMIRPENVFPSGLQTIKSGWVRDFDTTCSNRTQRGLGCAAWVVYKGNMDYLHCDGLTWNSRSCKDK